MLCRCHAEQIALYSFHCSVSTAVPPLSVKYTTWHVSPIFCSSNKKVDGGLSILSQKVKTLALLHRCLYPKPLLDPLPPPIAWGRQNVACNKYRELMVKSGHTGLTTHPCGFIIHPTKGWLGASPDAKVFDVSCSCCNGIAEFKCPYTK